MDTQSAPRTICQQTEEVLGSCMSIHLTEGYKQKLPGGLGQLGEALVRISKNHATPCPTSCHSDINWTSPKK